MFLTGILDTLKSMTFEFEIKPSIYALKEFVIPYMVEDDAKNAITLVNSNIPFTTVVNALMNYLLEENKIQQAAKFSTFNFSLSCI